MLIRNLVLTTAAATALFGSQLASADARVTVAHFAPFAEDIADTSVSVALNGVVARENVMFKDFTPYIDLPAGEYVVDIIPTGTSTVAITATYMLEDGKDYTVYASGNGSLQPLELFAIADDNTAPAAGNVKVRVVHSAPFAATLEETEVSIRTASGDLVGGLQGVQYGVASGYLEIPAGNYDLKVASNNGQVNYIDPLPVDLPEGTVATLFAVGDTVNQDLAIVATPIAELPLRVPVDDSTNGAYELDGYSRQGFWMTPIPAQNRVVGSWYTYTAEGETLWFTFSGPFDGVHAMTNLYKSSGDTEAEMGMTVKVGTIEFNVISCSLVEAIVTVSELPGLPGTYTTSYYDGIRITPSASCPPPES